MTRRLVPLMEVVRTEGYGWATTRWLRRFVERRRLCPVLHLIEGEDARLEGFALQPGKSQPCRNYDAR